MGLLFGLFKKKRQQYQQQAGWLSVEGALLVAAKVARLCHVGCRGAGALGVPCIERLLRRYFRTTVGAATFSSLGDAPTRRPIPQRCRVLVGNGLAVRDAGRSKTATVYPRCCKAGINHPTHCCTVRLDCMNRCVWACREILSISGATAGGKNVACVGMISHRNVRPHVSIQWQRWLATDPKETLVGCVDPLEGGSAHPNQCSRVHKTKEIGSSMLLAELVGIVEVLCNEERSLDERKNIPICVKN